MFKKRVQTLKSFLLPRLFFVNQKGLTLIEVIVSIAVLVIVGVALFALTITALTGTSANQNRNIGMQYASEGIEGMRTFRDQNGWSVVAPLNGTYYLKRSSSGFTLSGNPSDGNQGNGFNMSVIISAINANEKKVVVNVKYTEEGNDRNVVLVTFLSNWH